MRCVMSLIGITLKKSHKVSATYEMGSNFYFANVLLYIVCLENQFGQGVKKVLK